MSQALIPNNFQRGPVPLSVENNFCPVSVSECKTGQSLYSERWGNWWKMRKGFVRGWLEKVPPVNFSSLKTRWKQNKTNENS